MHTELQAFGTALVLAAMSFLVPATAEAQSHGVRVHRLMSAEPEKKPKHSEAKVTRLQVPRHTHEIDLKRALVGRKVTVRLDRRPRYRFSRYRRRHPGINRPWRWRPKPRSRAFMNPRGLYQSKIYRPGYF